MFKNDANLQMLSNLRNLNIFHLKEKLLDTVYMGTYTTVNRGTDMKLLNSTHVMREELCDENTYVRKIT